MMEPATISSIHGTIITKEITYSPENPEDFEYPFPDHHNATLYKKYKEKADSINNLLVCGRLGEYKYYDMDQAIARAFMLFEKRILPGSPS